MPLKLFLLDCNHTFVNAAKNFLSMFREVEVLGGIDDGPAALCLAELLQPDLVLMDVDAPVMRVMEVAHAMRLWSKPPHIVGLTMYDCAEVRLLFGEVKAFATVNKADFVCELIPILDKMIAEKRNGGSVCP